MDGGPLVRAEHVSRRYTPQKPRRIEYFFAKFGGIEPGEATLFEDEEEDEFLQDVAEAQPERPTRDFVALDDVSFVAEGGSCLALVGPTRAGKSLVLKIVAGLVPPTSGRVVVRGRVAPALDAAVALLPRRGSLARNLMPYAALLGLSARDVRRRLPEIFDFTGDPALRDLYIGGTDRGRRRMTLLALTLTSDAEVVLYDSAFSPDAFGERCRERLWQHRQAGKVVIVAARDVTSVETLADRIIYLERGRVVGEERHDPVAAQVGRREAEAGGG
jgi:ABC-type polysaccharide/polyol phosphate transport system ATPase subunit